MVGWARYVYAHEGYETYYGRARLWERERKKETGVMVALGYFETHQQKHDRYGLVCCPCFVLF